MFLQLYKFMSFYSKQLKFMSHPGRVHLDSAGQLSRSGSLENSFPVARGPSEKAKADDGCLLPIKLLLSTPGWSQPPRLEYISLGNSPFRLLPIELLRKLRFLRPMRSTTNPRHEFERPHFRNNSTGSRV